MADGSEKRHQSRFRWGSDGYFFYPWEKSFERIMTPFEQFIERETTSGLILMAGTVLALILANSPLKEIYAHVIHSTGYIGIAEFSIRLSLLHWINECLMAFFFFVVGLEIKREILVGELSDLKSAALPIVAAFGGMVVPALIYYLFNPWGDFAMGWGIPMTTDIAFCIGALVMLGRRVPKSLMVFLVSLAIADDLGAVVVIAIFYTDAINIWAFASALGIFFLLMVFNLSGVRNSIAYFLVGGVLWLFMLFSGVHAAVSGVVVAMCIPARGRYNPEIFGDRLRELAKQFDETTCEQECILSNVEQYSVLKAIDREGHLAEPPLQKMLDFLHLPVALIVIPLFALANAGITFDFPSPLSIATHPATLGVIIGLVVGKPIGITLISWIFIRLKMVSLPHEATMGHIFGVGLLGGIGFTMSIFIAELSFGGRPETLAIAKTGIIFASLIAGILGIMWLLWVSRNRQQEV
ncbi:MAG TPA: Na+/H+ antiporter NhaA [Deltaproteobacteria bacterium]|nr:Na+/H+ antiporter NhaA [Deltaproteobacteria bacterium]